MSPTLREVSQLFSPGSAPRRGLFLSITTAVAAICGVFAVVMVDARSDARRAAEASELNLATALAHDMDRDIGMLDLSMQAARDAWLDPRVRALPPDLRQMAVFDHSVETPYVDCLVVADASGAIVADSRSAVPPPVSLRDAAAFRAQRDGDAGLAVVRPERLPGRPGWRLGLSRRMVDRDGRFAGAVVAYLDLDAFGEAFKHLPLGSGGALILFHSDGTLLIREPEVRGAVGHSFRGQATFEPMQGRDGGTFEGESVLDGRSRLYAFHRVGRLPLIQSVAVSTDDVYAGWRAKAAALGAALAVLCSVLMALLFALKRELLQREAAQQALDALASTDPLTGLLNRRRFFERAEAACAEAAAEGAPVAVVMVDVDHFKAYNDRYGHAAGDRALVAVAGAVRGALRGGVDAAARYGGEEFVALLPGLGRAEALAAAEDIRAAVAGLAAPHDRAPAGFVTVSLGVASAEAGAAAGVQALVEAADAALYRSKRDGRNRSSGGERLLARYPRPEALSA